MNVQGLLDSEYILSKKFNNLKNLKETQKGKCIQLLFGILLETRC